jgi:predicted transcriptional regulator
MSSIVDEKLTAKAFLRGVIDAQPEDSSYEEIMRELAFQRMVDRGLDDVRTGRSLSHDDTLKRVRSWRS